MKQKRPFTGWRNEDNLVPPTPTHMETHKVSKLGVNLVSCFGKKFAARPMNLNSGNQPGGRLAWLVKHNLSLHNPLP